jgi:hypothetical protein
MRSAAASLLCAAAGGVIAIPATVQTPASTYDRLDQGVHALVVTLTVRRGQEAAFMRAIKGSG